MVHVLLSRVKQDVEWVYLSNPKLSRADLFNYLALKVLKRTTPYTSKAAFLVDFEAHLRTCRQRRKTFLLIVDEAQALPVELLEEIRLLSNLETDEEKLISIFLVGQPELNQKLSAPRSRAILQRVSYRYHIKPLDLEAARAYMEARLQQAGAKEEIFTKEAIQAVHACSKGYPRLINVLAENALLLGYAQGKKKITAPMVLQCHEDMQIPSAPPEQSEPKPNGPKFQIEPVRPAPRRTLRWSLAAAFILVLGLAAFLWREGVLDDVKEVLKARGFLPTATAKLEPAPPPVKWVEEPAPFRAVEAPEQAPTIEMPSVTVSDPKEVPVELAAEPAAPEPEAAEKVAPQTVKVQPGDTLTKLAVAIYGRADQEVLDLVKEANPNLSDTNRILLGQVLIFPPLGEKSR
jgi:general secretion pathway protein A